MGAIWGEGRWSPWWWSSLSLDSSVGGIDEAGRGAVLGPLVIAGVALRASVLESLRQAGVRDSKQLSPQRREKLYATIINLADRVEVIEVSPQEIDSRYRRGLNLNQLELIKMAQIALRLGVKTVYVDAVDVDEQRFAKQLSEKAPNVVFISEHAADSKYTVTAAASIVAKVTRDRRIAELRQIYGDIGSGYPSDPRTVAFLERYYVEHGLIPEFARATWKSIRKNLGSSV